MEFIGQQISPPAYDVLWKSAMPNDTKPAVLHVASPGETEHQRRQIVHRAHAELHRAGYAGPRGVVAEVGALLNMMVRPPVAVDVRMYERTPAGGQRPARLTRVGARVTTNGSRGAAAVLGPGWFRMWSFPTGSLVDEVIRLLPYHDAPARFSGFSLPPDELMLRPARRGESALRLLEGPYLRRAHICVVFRDPVAGAERVSNSVVVNDIEAGRYLVFMARNEITVASGRRGTFERKLKEMLEPARR